MRASKKSSWTSSLHQQTASGGQNWGGSGQQRSSVDENHNESEEATLVLNIVENIHADVGKEKKPSQLIAANNPLPGTHERYTVMCQWL